MVTFLDCSTLTKSEREKYISALPAEIAARKSEQEQSLLADGFSRYAVAERFGVCPEKLDVRYNENGKPLLIMDEAYFSISHSGTMICTAVGDLPIGVDIEKIRDIGTSLLKQLTAKESEYVNAPYEGWEARFLQIWTLKEAWIKCEGLQLGNYNDIHFIIGKASISSTKIGYHFEFLQAPDGYVGAICEKIM